jgi:hypothetical protein
MGKRNRYFGHDCAYCGGVGVTETRDHVLAKEFVLPRHRDRLPIIPACRRCNAEKANLERELTALLPFGARHGGARETLETMVPSRLRGNARLHRDIAASFGPEWVVSPSGSYEYRGKVLIDAEMIQRWLQFVTVGLVRHHWDLVVGGKVNVLVDLPTPGAANRLARFFSYRAARKIPSTTIGGGALTYEAAMAVDNPMLSVWRFAIYDGIEFAGEDESLRASTHYVFLHPQRLGQATATSLGQLVPPEVAGRSLGLLHTPAAHFDHALSLSA